MVGAGPAGSVTAHHLARAGASVLLLDRERFPRDKPCGGGVTLRAARLLPFALDPVVEDWILEFLAGRAPSLEPYTAALRGALARTLANSWAAKRALDRFPRTTFALASTRPVQRALERLARGDPQSRPVSALGGIARRSRLSSVA